MARKTPAAANIPLRLRRRRDGTLALTDERGAVDGDGRVFPESHVFPASWLISSGGVATLDGDTLTLTLCNASATYRIVEQDAAGNLHGELEAASLGDTPKIDEKAAAKLAAQSEEA